MRALTFREPEVVALDEVADPSIEAPGDVVLRVELAGICGSDLHVYHGRETGLDRGTVLGHEAVGEIVAVGSDVARFRVGERVVIPFTTSCGICRACRRGLTARCERGNLFGWVEEGRGLHGAQAELLRVPLADSTLVGVPPDLPSRTALLAGDVLATGLFAAELGGVEPGDTVAVLGCGAVGLMAVVGALDRGAARVFAVDPIEERRFRAEAFGATAVDPEGAAAHVAAATHGLGVDAVLEAVGSAAASELAYSLVRSGGTLAAVGVHTEPHLAISPAEIYDRNLTYRSGRCSARRLLPRALELLLGSRWSFDPVVSHVLGLGEAVDAYRLFAERAPGCSKILLAPILRTPILLTP